VRIVVTGTEGQVARSLQRAGALAGHEVLALGRPGLDLAGDPADIGRALAGTAPDIIISVAAYTAVDLAEDEPDLAEDVNARGAGGVATAANRLGVPLLHLSTDYVFDGTKDAPYSEDDETGPTSVYGRSKLHGEQAVLAAHDNVAVLRTAWVYSPFGRNFVKTMLNLAKDRPEVRVVADQFGNPTSALDIAAALLKVADGLIRSGDQRLRGIFHMAAPDEASWADFAEHIFTVSAQHGGPSATVVPIRTIEFPTRARRPANSRLDCTRLSDTHGVTLPRWRGSTALVVKELLGVSNKKAQE
jgi:dTDP-4-dehydrorhamnose reductase